MNKGNSSRIDGSGVSPALKRHNHGKPATRVSPRVAALLTVAATSVLWAIAWLLALSD